MSEKAHEAPKMPPKAQPKKTAVLGRAVKMLFAYYPVLVPLAIAGINNRLAGELAAEADVFCVARKEGA